MKETKAVAPTEPWYPLCAPGTERLSESAWTEEFPAFQFLGGPGSAVCRQYCEAAEGAAK
ncbi:hypothetical protein Dalk_0600 [Desulfatibacillum aliphaticivorans]|uniref:Uncharacterized protein n=1 Tax=Desulfatibacillum aliphaticivorans TaxID=218208 RepID=B8FHL7_DESAL|nr:hypothetical protein Dalk_0600 [Desulfatibacillum aliphaticivorans]